MQLLEKLRQSKRKGNVSRILTPAFYNLPTRWQYLLKTASYTLIRHENSFLIKANICRIGILPGI